MWISPEKSGFCGFCIDGEWMGMAEIENHVVFGNWIGGRATSCSIKDAWAWAQHIRNSTDLLVFDAADTVIGLSRARGNLHKNAKQLRINYSIQNKKLLLLMSCDVYYFA